MKKYLTWKLLAIIVFTLFFGFFDLPAEIQTKILPFTPETITKTKINLGLDLQGGSQLDYKIDLRKVPQADRESIIEGVQEVIERRVNRLGVAEPNIYRSTIGEEAHIIVELAQTAKISQEDVDKYIGKDKKLEELSDNEKKLVTLEKAKDTVGKTIQLEFKEEKGTLDPQEKDKIKTLAVNALNQINSGENYDVVGQEESQAYPGKVKFETSEYIFLSNLPTQLKEILTKLKVGEYNKELAEIGGSFVIDGSGQAVEESAFAIVKLIDVKEEVKNPKEIYVSHILIAWAGLETADATVTRTEDEAFKLAKEIKGRLDKGENFALLAKEFSNDPGTKETGGLLDKPVTGDGGYVFDFEKAAQDLKIEEISDPVKTKFGYHLIKADDIQENVKENQYKYKTIAYSTRPDPWKETGLTGEHFVRADVQLDNFFQPYIQIQFNEEGGKLFEEITERNINKKLAIFVGGDEISSPVVNQKITGGLGIIEGQFTQEEAETLARDLNTGAIPAPIVLTGEYTIGATLGQESLSKSIYAGLIGILLVMIFMLIYYRLPGLIANFALIIYGATLLFLIKSQLHLGISLLVSLIIFGYLISKIVNNQDSGWEKFLSFIITIFGFFFLTFLLKTGVVLTLAGIAGIILSFGMAVDANILIFERMKEELREGKPMSAAINEGFARAWSAIRDSNFSSLLTCAILFYFGSSIIRGFAFNLAAGILVSMFTAIVITKTMLHTFVGTKIAENLKLFGVNKKPPLKFKFVQYSRHWLTFSGTLVVISIILISIFGLNLGIDFKGGTLMEFEFKEPVKKQLLNSTFEKIEQELTQQDNENSSQPSTSSIISESKSTDKVLKADTQSMVDLRTAQIIATGEGEKDYIVKTKYITSENHDQILAKMKKYLPEFDEKRFTTIGPSIGKTLLHKAIIAIILAVVMITIYLAFAFRRVPKEVNPWRFGITAIIALLHDILIVTGIFAILGKFLNVEIDALYITAMLIVFGYSVHDTIVVLDRLREKLIQHSSPSFKETANQALNETLARSINTSLSALLTLIAILIFGSPSIFYFVLALTIGITIGTYSSIFVATFLLVEWQDWKR